MQQKILIIDDEANFREIFSLKLAAAGYLVDTAASGEDGIKKIKESKPDLVLLDIKMPGMGGEEIIKLIRQDPDISYVGVVFTTSLGEQSDTEADEVLAKKFGADGYIRKTENLDNFVALVAAHLQGPK